MIDDRTALILRVARWTTTPVFAINAYPDERDNSTVRETLQAYYATLEAQLDYVSRALLTDLPERIETSMLDGPLFLVEEVRLEPGRLADVQEAALNSIPTTTDEEPA